MPAKRRNHILAFTAFLALMLLGPPEVEAQQTGTITGRVVSASGQNPLAAVQVSIAGTGIGGITNADGRYLLTAVPAGEATVRATLVGRGTEQLTTTVGAGETVVLDFELRESAIALDEIVVTGAGVATERRKLGNTVGAINTEELENAPIRDISQLLQGREVGVASLPGSGLAGQGTRIRIRGSASLSQSNEPIVYVNGIRVDNGGGFGPGVSASGPGTTSRLDDIDPESIERIEILKGAAAATLYGTEASNGVIQIFTKQGTQGPPRWNAQFNVGAAQVPTNRIKPLADFARNQEDVDRIRSFWGRDVQPYEVFQQDDLLNDFFETGVNTATSLSVQGGGDLITYFASGRYTWEDGIHGMSDVGPARDVNQKAHLTGNMTIFPTENFRVRLSTHYSEVSHETVNSGNSIYAPWEDANLGQLRLADENNAFGVPAFATVREGMQVTPTQEIQHFTGSLNLSFQPAGGLSLDGTFGIDMVNQHDEELTPYGWNVDNYTTNDITGSKAVSDRNFRELTLDLKSSWDARLAERIDNTFLVGVQGFLSETVTSGGTGEDFPGPGLEVAGAGANQTLREAWLREVNAGFFFQDQVGYHDWAFLTLGARYDYNSAFGEAAGGVLYPKASISVVPSSFDSWRSSAVSSLRFRAAIGQSGLQPGAFDKFTTFSPLPSVSGPGVQPDNLGNPDLAPEVSTEWELGAEAGFIQDRASVELTYWNRKVSDALVARQFPVSGGFRAEQLDNIGLLKAWGVDIGLQGLVVDKPGMQVDLFTNVAYLQEEVVDLGGAPPLKVGGSYPRIRNFLIEGYAPGAFFGAKLADVPIPVDVFNNCTEPTREEALEYFSEVRTLDEFEVLAVTPSGEFGGPACGGDFLANHLGKPTPDWQGSVGGSLRLGSSLEVSSLFEFKAGNFYWQDLGGAFNKAHPTIGRNWAQPARIEATMLNPQSTAEERLDAAIEWAREIRSLAPMSGMNNIHKADYMRWRELSLTYYVPGTFVQEFAVDNMSVTLSGRNLHLWVNSDYEGVDPEVNSEGRCEGGGLSCNFLTGVEIWNIPIPRSVGLTVRIGF